MRDQAASLPRETDGPGRSIDCGLSATRSALLLALMDTRNEGDAWRDTVRAAASVAAAAATLARSAGGTDVADRLLEVARAMGSAHGLPRANAVELVHRAILGCGVEVTAAS